jgi:LmbE family N-acetylglucosaminyl deacetylase
MRFSALTLVLAGGLGFVFGSVMNGRGPDAALAAAAAPAQAGAPAQASNDGKLRIIIFGAHPDDAQYIGSGVAMKWAKLGYHVKLVSATNGDIGHWQMAGGPLAERRKQEVMAVGERLGVTTQVLDIHDGEIMPTLEYRRTFARLIREWNADVVITHRPNDYHPDHRYTSILVQDSAYMVGVPFFTEVPPLKKNPVYLYSADRFQHPYPFHADVAVGIDDVVHPTVDALMLMVSQLQEGGADGNASLYPPNDAAARARRDEEIRASLTRRYSSQADKYRDALVKFYGPERGQAIHYAQAFEICEYGRQPTETELKQIFPF